jgi:hypothetical protein
MKIPSAFRIIGVFFVFCFVSEESVLAVSTVPKGASTKSSPVKDNLSPRITGLSPIVWIGTDGVEFKLSQLFGLSPTAIYFGGIAASGFTFKNNIIDCKHPCLPHKDPDSGTVDTFAPAITPGASVQVSVVFNDGTRVTSPTPYSVAIADLQVDGPRAWDPNTGGDSGWVGGASHAISYRGGQSIAIATSSPEFYVSTSFNHIGANLSYNPPYYLGNKATFNVNVQMCDVVAGPTPTQVSPPTGSQGPCTDYAGNPGFWINVGGAQQIASLPAQELASATNLIAVKANNVVDPTHLARTVRLGFGLSLQDTNKASNNLDDYVLQQPFTVVLAPTQMAQLKVSPFAILYAPPGDESTATFSISSKYTVDMNVGSGTKITSSIANDAIYSAKVTLGIGASSYASESLSIGEDWDHGTQFGYGNNLNAASESTGTQVSTWSFKTVADYGLIPGLGVTCKSQTDCSTLIPPTTATYQPFRHDVFILNIHPQFAVWNFSPTSAQYLLMAAAPGFSLVDVATLWQCADGGPFMGNINFCDISYGDTQVDASGTAVISVGSQLAVTLTANEARNLLKLDPFATQGQGAGLNPSRALLIGKTSYGAKAGELETTGGITGDTPSAEVDVKYQNEQAVKTTSSGETDYTATATYVDQTTLGWAQAATSLFFNMNESVSFGNKVTQQNQTTLSYTDSSAVTTDQTIEADVSFQDYDNTMIGSSGKLCANCHGPLPIHPIVAVWLDRSFGGFMFQDPDATTNRIPSRAEIFNAALLSLVNQEQNHQRFSDVPKTDPANAAIGIAIRAGVLAGFPDGTFRPNLPITRAQLAIALVKALRLPLVGGSTFDDVSAADGPLIMAAVKAGFLASPNANFSPDQPVSQQETSDAMFRGFGYRVKALAESTNNTNAMVTRSQAAVSILAAAAAAQK